MTLADQAQADLDRLQRAREQIITQLSKTIVGQQDVIEQLLISIFARGHCCSKAFQGLQKP